MPSRPVLRDVRGHRVVNAPCGELCAAAIEKWIVAERAFGPRSRKLTDLLGGEVLAMFADTPVLLPHIRAGKLKPIGDASAQRNPMLADVSTLAEQGFPDMPGGYAATCGINKSGQLLLQL
jgi:tripartite-type tricarboxylate transporter receptor subunit TctC